MILFLFTAFQSANAGGIPGALAGILSTLNQEIQESYSCSRWRYNRSFTGQKARQDSPGKHRCTGEKTGFRALVSKSA